MGTIQIDQVHKSFGEAAILKGINLTIDDGGFTVLLGPSGCGKSTLLRIIAGLETPTAGTLRMNGRDITAAQPKDRQVAMVFQNYALYPHMTVFQNVEYGLKIQKVPKAERKSVVEAALAQVELTDQRDKLPGRMSGGQRQRVALARAIVKRPEAFLMDEPLSNLDAKLRTAMRVELAGMHAALGATFLYVTHDQVEAMSMGTYIVIMHEGVIMQKGTPQQIYENPANLFVAGFIGSPPANLLPLGGGITAGVRPEHVRYARRPSRGISLRCRVQSVEQLGAESILHTETKLGAITLRSPTCWGSLSDSGFVQLDERRVLCFGEDGHRIDNTPAVRALRALGETTPYTLSAGAQ